MVAIDIILVEIDRVDSIEFDGYRQWRRPGAEFGGDGKLFADQYF